MVRYVVDSSVAATPVFRGEPFHPRAMALFEQFAKHEIELITVPLLISEVANAIWNAVRLDRLGFDDAMEAVRKIAESRVPGSGVNPGAASWPWGTEPRRVGIDQAVTGGFLLGVNPPRKEERPPVTDLRMALLELLSKYKDDGQLDPLREGVRLLAQALMELEVSEEIGAERYQRTDERKTYRNGYRKRRRDTRVGRSSL